MTPIARTHIAPLQDLPTLPAAVVDLLDLLARDDTDTPALAAKIALDPALAAKTLRLANSSFYGLPRHVSSLADAASVLGLRTLRSVVTTAALNASVPVPECEGFDFDTFWRHAVSVAVGAKVLALEVGADEEAAFTAGLLHDMGRLVLARAHPGRYAEVLAHGDARGAGLENRELELLGVDHSEVGALVAERWQFPKSIVAAIGGHHAQGREPLAAANLAGLVRLADEWVHAIAQGALDGSPATIAFEEMRHAAGLAPDALQRLLREIDERARTICVALLH